MRTTFDLTPLYRSTVGFDRLVSLLDQMAGYAARAFERVFQLADFVEVKGATLENGLLHVDLARELPEKMKPRQIRIASPAESKVIETKAA